MISQLNSYTVTVSGCEQLLYCIIWAKVYINPILLFLEYGGGWEYGWRRKDEHCIELFQYWILFGIDFLSIVSNSIDFFIMYVS